MSGKKLDILRGSQRWGPILLRYFLLDIAAQSDSNERLKPWASWLNKAFRYQPPETQGVYECLRHLCYSFTTTNISMEEINQFANCFSLSEVRKLAAIKAIPKDGR